MSAARDPQPSGGFARDAALLTVGLAAAQGLLLAAMPLWSRLYGPEQFAALGVWMAVSAMVGMLLLLRYDSAIVVARDDDEARALRRLGLALAVGGGVLLALASLLLPAGWRTALGLAPLGPWLPLAVVAGALSAAFTSGLAGLNRERAYVRMSGARVLGAAVAVAVGTAWGLASFAFGPGLLLAQFAGALTALLALRWQLVPHSGVRAAARRHLDAPRFLWPAAMLDTVTQQLPLLLVAAWFGAELAGQFSLAWRVLALPALLLAGAAGSVFYQRFAATLGPAPAPVAGAVAADDQAASAVSPSAARGPRDVAVARVEVAAARALMLRTWRAFALIGIAPALIVIAFGEPLFAWLFGARWVVAGQLAAALAPLLLAMTISSPTSGALVVLGLHRFAPVFGVAMLLYRPAALWIGAERGSLGLAIGLWAACEVVAIGLYNRLLWRALVDRARRGAATG